jgi:NAD(P)-dependent dehydrogenase (short-subunit alcohol dehydrogenase family)
VSSERVILVTGCSSGIGRATALEAALRGHRVFASARNRNDLADLERRENLVALTLDVTDAGSIRSAVEAVLARAGRLDALVNNAGYGQYGAAEDVTPDEWRAQFEVNLFGAIAVMQAVLPAMRTAAGGTIVNVSSVAGRVAVPFASPYSASKHALEAVSDALRVELGPFGIRVVLVEPGPIETRFGDRARSIVAPLISRPGPYRAVYTLAERAMDGEFQKGKLPAEAVARVIVDAVEARRPRARYPVGRIAHALMPLKRALPDRLFDALMRRSLGMSSGPTKSG